MRYTYPQKARINCETCDLQDVENFIAYGTIVWILSKSDKPYVHPVWGGTERNTSVVKSGRKLFTVYSDELEYEPMNGHTLVECADENWKTQLARQYPNIPAGAKIKILRTDFVNFYGLFCEVKWKDNIYYVKHTDIAVDEGPEMEEGLGEGEDKK